MKLRTIAAILALAVPAFTFAQQNNFTILTNGTPTGKCYYTFDKAKDGYKVVSHYQSRISPHSITVSGESGDEGASKVVAELQQIHSFKLDGSYQFLGSAIQDMIAQMNIGYSPNKQRTLLTISKVQGGAAESMPQMPLQHDLIVLPDFDASAIQALVLMAVNHPPTDGLFFLIVPPDSPRGGPLNGQARWSRGSDTAGTLDGKPVTVHHFSLPYGDNNYEIYADPDNTLLQVDVKTLHASYVRNGFVLAK